MEKFATPAAVEFWDQASHWLDRYTGHTRSAAEKEVRRFVLWCDFQSYDPRQAASPQAQQYLDFLRNPEPAEQWVGQSVPRLLSGGSHNPRWKPFAGPLAPASIRLARTHLNGLYGYLLAEGVTPRNPFHATRVHAEVRRRDLQVEKSLSAAAVAHLMRFLATMPGHTLRQARKKAFYQLLMQLFLATGLRRFEVGLLARAHVHRTQDGLWLRVQGKGNVLADVPLPEQILLALDRYEVASRALGQDMGPDRFLLPGRKGQAKSGSGVYRLVRRILEAAAETAEPDVAAELSRATPHWMRHTYAQRLVDAGAPLDVVRDNLRHASLATTSKYLRSSRVRRQAETITRAGAMWEATAQQGQRKTTEELGRLEEDVALLSGMPGTGHRK
jgi:integrase/recombinase XerD